MTDAPDFRATVLRGGVRLVDWGPWLADGGPMGMHFRRLSAGVAIADLTVLRDADETATEIVVEFRRGDSALVRATLERWAASVGYRRLWFPDALVHLDPAAGGTAATRCTCCRATWCDDDHDFWLSVRKSGRFPTLCPLCGSDLPQWEATPCT